MKISIGLPGLVPGVRGATLLEWARRAERRGFASVIVDERLMWDGYETLVCAAAAAAVTERIKITAAVVVAPLRRNVAEFAKQAASIDRLSNGRFVLGLGVGSRRDDFEISHVEFHHRGRLTDALLEECSTLWGGNVAGFGPTPTVPGGPQLIFGGSSDATFRRAARFGSGWVCATSGGPDGLRAGAARLAAEWQAAGRSGSARLLALAPRFALGPNGPAAVDSYVRAYNAYRGPGAAQRAASSLVRDADVKECVAAFRTAGCDELIINPADGDPDQVDLLAEAVGREFLEPV